MAGWFGNGDGRRMAGGGVFLLGLSLGRRWLSSGLLIIALIWGGESVREGCFVGGLGGWVFVIGERVEYG